VQDINRRDGRRVGSNKLRTYCTFKTTSITEKYLKVPMQFKQRSALAKFRCGVAPLHIETGRYTNTPIDLRVCQLCTENVLENEEHVLLKCNAYNDLRLELFSRAVEIQGNFNDMSSQKKLEFILSDERICYLAAKTCERI
jgi:hypothetical protein